MTARHGVLLDLDGTLVDSVYHHVIAWNAALRSRGYEVALADIHHAIGMGSDRIVAHLLGATPEDADELSADHTHRFLALADDLRPTCGARALLDDLNARDVPHVIATSAGAEEADALLSALGADPPRVDSSAVRHSKPSPDLFLAACEQLAIEASDAIVIGDSPWDAEAAARMGSRAVSVRCGGFSDSVLMKRGAAVVVADPGELVGQL